MEVREEFMPCNDILILLLQPDMPDHNTER